MIFWMMRTALQIIMSEKMKLWEDAPVYDIIFGNRHLRWQHEKQDSAQEKEQDGSGEVGWDRNLFFLHACCELI